MASLLSRIDANSIVVLYVLKFASGFLIFPAVVAIVVVVVVVIFVVVGGGDMMCVYVVVTVCDYVCIQVSVRLI